MTQAEQIQLLLIDAGVEENKLEETATKILSLFQSSSIQKKHEKPKAIVSAPGAGGESVPVEQPAGISHKTTRFSIDKNGNI